MDSTAYKIQGLARYQRKSGGFYNTFAPIVDLIAFNPLIDYLHKDKDIVYMENFACRNIIRGLLLARTAKLQCVVRMTSWISKSEMSGNSQSMKFGIVISLLQCVHSTQKRMVSGNKTMQKLFLSKKNATR